MLERRLYRHIDWLFVGALALLCAIGVAMIYSTTYEPTTGTVGREVTTQLVALGLGLIAFVAMLSVDYRWLSDSCHPARVSGRSGGPDAHLAKSGVASRVGNEYAGPAPLTAKSAAKLLHELSVY